jgi:hypothetical protein
VTKDTPVEFTFPAGWRLNSEEHPFDLQCLSSSEDMNTGVFVYRREDVSLDSKLTDFFQTRVDDLKSKRRNVEDLDALQRREFDDKTVTSVSFLGDKDHARHCYTFSLIEFRQENSPFAIVLQVSMPGDRKTSVSLLGSIVRSARLLPEQD